LIIGHRSNLGASKRDASGKHTPCYSRKAGECQLFKGDCGFVANDDVGNPHAVEPATTVNDQRPTPGRQHETGQPASFGRFELPTPQDVGTSE
jgi:hypothetical protein